jgi:nucleoside-diphosphate-sugar epimerase
MQGIDVVVQMAADPRLDASWESVLASNIVGARNVFEAAHRSGVGRVVFASSITVSLGHLLDEPYRLVAEGRYGELSPDDLPKVTHERPPRPAALYPASKVWGEALGRYYADVHHISVICLRIGWVTTDDRPDPCEWGKSVWCSQRDVVQMVERSIQAPDDLRFDVFYVLSDNKWNWADIDHAREVLGYIPQDSAEERPVGTGEERKEII